MKMLVETTGAFMLLDLSLGQTVQGHRPSVVAQSDFLNARIALHQVTKICDLPDDATDEEFETYWTDAEDRELAIASYQSKFDAEAAPAAMPKNRRTAR